MKPDRGDVVIAVFPGELGKTRPAVVLQPEELSEIFSTILACPLTTHLVDAPLLRPIIAPNTENGLRELSQIMVEKISPLKNDAIRQQVGRLGAGDMKRLEIALAYVTGLSYSVPPANETRQSRENP